MATSPSIDRMTHLRKQIHENVAQVQANKMQCERLCQRIDRLIDPLERLEHAPASIVREETRDIIEKFLQFLDECNDYITKFQSIDPNCDDVIDNDKIHELNQRLSQFSQDLCLGLNIQQLFDRQHDENDRRTDAQELSGKIDDICRRNLNQPIDQMLDRHFQSLRFYLAQQFSSQQATNPAPQLVHDHTPFLQIPYQDFLVDSQPLASGGFADVYKATWLTHHDQVAIKVLHLRHLSTIRDDFQREISTMYRVRYEHVLTVLGACVAPDFYAIVLEYMPLGSLYDVLHDKQPERIVFDWTDRYSLAWQMSKSINYLHNLNPSILHRDIKSMNFLLKYNGIGQKKYLVKVCDFGLAEIRRETLRQSVSVSPIVGSFVWKAPELFSAHNRCTKQSDVYSLGMVFWELASGERPWDEYDDETIILIQVKSGERPTIPLDIPEQYKQWIQDAWHHDPQKRPTCFQLMERIYTEMNYSPQRRETKSIDLQPEERISTQYDSVISSSSSDSTQKSIEVTAEVDEHHKLMNSFSDSQSSETSTEEKTELKSTLEYDVAAESTVSPIERISSKSTADLASYFNEADSSNNQKIVPIYRIEKRRPLHRKPVTGESNRFQSPR